MWETSCVNYIAILTRRLGLLCRDSFFSTRVATASSADWSGSSPCNLFQIRQSECTTTKFLIQMWQKDAWNQDKSNGTYGFG